MALDTYDGLKSAVDDYLNREGYAHITQRTDEFIDMAQRRVNRKCRLPAMESVRVLNVDAQGKALLPSGFMDVKYIVVADSTSAWALTRSTFTEVKKTQVGSMYCQPRIFDIEGGSIYIGAVPQASQTVTLVYYKELPLVSATVSENWFTQNAPEVLLWAALAEAAVFLKDFELAEAYELKYMQAMKDLQDERAKSEHSGSPMSVRAV